MRPLSRRAALAGATGALLVPRAAVAATDDDQDGVLVLKLATQAHVSAETYAHDLRQPALTGRLKALAAQIHQQENEHVQALSDTVTKLTGSAPKFQPIVFAAVVVSDPKVVLQRAAQRESALLGAAERVIPALSKASLAALVASIMANDAQHLALLSSALGKDPLPTPFAPAP